MKMKNQMGALLRGGAVLCAACLAGAAWADEAATVKSALDSVLGLRTNREFSQLCQQLGFTLDASFRRQGMFNPDTAPAANDCVDRLMTHVAPVVKQAVEKLKSVPTSWKGGLELTPGAYPIDEKVTVDAADVCFLRAYGELALGLGYLAKGMDSKLDNASLDQALNTYVTIPVIASAPPASDTGVWASVPAYYGDRKSSYYAKLAFHGDKLYVLVRSDAPAKTTLAHYLNWFDFKLEDTAGVRAPLDFWMYDQSWRVTDAGKLDDVSAYDWLIRCTYRSDVERPRYDDYYVNREVVQNGETYIMFEERYPGAGNAYWEAQEAYEATIAKPKVDVSTTRGFVMFAVDLSEAAPDADHVAWRLDYASVDMILRASVRTYPADPGCGGCGPSYGLDREWDGLSVEGGNGDSVLYCLMKEQTGLVSGVRDASALASAKTWFSQAFTTLKSASDLASRRNLSAAVRPLIHLKDAQSVAKLTKITRQTKSILAALDKSTKLDLPSMVASDDTDIRAQLSALPGSGRMDMNLSKLFTGGVTHGLVPDVRLDNGLRLEVDVDSFVDPTLGGCLPGMTRAIWEKVLAQSVTVYHSGVTPTPAPDASGLGAFSPEAAVNGVAPYCGGVYDAAGNVVGAIQLKVGKASARSNTAKVSGSVVLLDGKKHALSSVAVPTGATAQNVEGMSVGKIGTASLKIGANGFEGTLTTSLGVWTVRTARLGGDLQTSSLTFRLGDFTAPDLGAGMVCLAECLPTAEPVLIANGKWSTRAAAAPKYVLDKASGLCSLQGLDDQNKPNRPALKLSYTAKTGVMKGSFKLYYSDADSTPAGKKPKIKKLTVNVTGVVVDGVGTGRATCKRPAGVWNVTVD